ncbi:DNA polymerase III subunit chi [Paracoccus aerodenitrificans]|uniref:DNA polymerase III subunit chi n=1 Tax=Paracoccus aerodenitrificans TaxID=3017781 RepID=UPI0022F02505|nr:DNA polymerase III subunit chi [Paracoccus aerodenitrificans]WBU64169.1 DNA polymerase III subunit chi [Paracoccus aerodenitrificans]
MGNALFYHLTRSTPERLLPLLLGKAMAAGWRVELRGRGAERLARLDEALWMGDGFLPHGLAGGAHDARQPVLLRDAEAPPAANAPTCLMAVDGADIVGDEAMQLERVCIIFDGNDPSAVERAREQWRSLTAQNVTAEYWSEAGGRWERKR